MLEASRPGVSEAEVFTAGMAEGLRRGAHTPHMLISSGPGFVSWGPAPWSYRPQPPRVIQDGDVIMAEAFNSIALKESQHQVAIAVGEVHPDIEEAAKVARACYDIGLSLLRPGHTFGEVADAMVRTLKDAAGCSPMILPPGGRSGKASTLVIATGAVPERPPLPGADAVGVFGVQL